MTGSEAQFVLVVDQSAAFGHALVELLDDAGLPGRWSTTWAREPAPTTVLCAADLLAGVPGDFLPHTVVAVDDLSAGVVRNYLGRGLPSVVDRVWPVERIAHVVVEAAAGRSVLPTSLLRDALTGDRPAVDLDLSAEERSWLEAFAQGRSSGWVARQAHISERQLYRRLQGIYERLGVTNRSAAIAVLSRHS
jgi:two-component system nitrate/nitrite response regulator NarL